ncbi:MAG: OmpA family protein [Syntrophales bacterium]|jgi:outer membrane protein OmpA-like peptidoglycan-associated protein
MIIKKNSYIVRVLQIAMLFVLLLNTGCAPATKVVLLPDPDDKVGVVDVSSAKGIQTLNKSWQTTEVSSPDKAPSVPSLMDEKDVRAMFKEALAAEPIPPTSFNVYFKTAASNLTTESLKTLSLALGEIKVRKSTDIIVSGHTDAVGSVEKNRELSLKRAKVVTDFIVSKGVKPENIEVTYHGKGNPLILTPDGVAEPRNRRVEIIVR